MPAQRANIHVSGIVQGVGFRPYIFRLATHLKLVGTVQNLGDAEVEIILEGRSERIKEFLEKLQSQKPPLAVIDDVYVKMEDPEGIFDQMQILPSSDNKKGRGSLIPPDIGLCDVCEEELCTG